MSAPDPSASRRPSRAPRLRALLVGVAAMAVAAPLAVIVPSVADAADPPTVTVTPGTDLDPDGQTVTVTGSGFDASDGRGIYVQFCQQAVGESGTPEGRPGGDDCSDAQAWVSGDFRAPDSWSDAGEGTFEVQLEAIAAFSDVDCTDPETVCGFSTRGDHMGPDFFGNDTFTPVTFAAAEPAGPQVTVSPADDLDPSGQTVTVSGSGFDTSDGKGVYVRFCAQADGEVGTVEGRPAGSDCNGQSAGKGAWIGHGPPANPVWDGDGFELDLEAIGAFSDVDCLDPETVCGFATQSDHTGLSFFGNDTFTPVTFADDGEDPGPGDGGEDPDPGDGGEDPDDGGQDPGDPSGDSRAQVDPTTGLDAEGDTVRVRGSGYPGGVGVYVRLCETPTAPVGTMAGRQVDCHGQGIWATNAQTGPGTAPIAGGSFDLQLEVAGAFTGENAAIDCMEPGSCGVFIRRDHMGPTDTAYDAFFPLAFDEDTEAPDVDDPRPPSLNEVVLEVSQVEDVDDGATLQVSGSKYAAGQGIYVQFCQAPEGQLGTAAGRPGAESCYPGQDGTHTVWVTPIAANGTFETPLIVEKTFENESGELIDCSEPESCGVFTRRDHVGGATDYSQDAFVPISFGDGVAAAREPGIITADRTSGLDPNGDTINVTGERFRSGVEYAVAVCAADGITCDYDNVVEVAASEDVAGTFQVSLPVRGAFSGIDCSTVGCEVNTWAVSLSTPEDEAVLPISFSGPAMGGITQLPRTGSDVASWVGMGTGTIVVGFVLAGATRRRRELA